MFNLLCRKLSLLDAATCGGHPCGGAAFRLKLLHAAGLAPQLGACAHCGEPERLVGFSGAAGGVVCGACEAASFPLGRTLTASWCRPSPSALAEAPAASEQTLGQVERAISETLEHHAHLRLMPVAGRASVRRAG